MEKPKGKRKWNNQKASKENAGWLARIKRALGKKSSKQPKGQGQFYKP